MQLIGYKSECSKNVIDNIHNYTDLYREHSSISDYKMTYDSITKSRVFPIRYVDKHTWKTYGYKTNYITSFENKNNCLHKIPKQGNSSCPSRNETNSKLVGKVYKSRYEDTSPIITKNVTTVTKDITYWNCPHDNMQ
tara:strand:- start:828 stop:1238 length:411 start_codon:yes stop_codon:yes gene_type:complete